MKVLLVGSTGLVGAHVLKLALIDQRITQVVALSRQPLPEHPKLQNILVDFAHLPKDALWWQVDAVICTLGTTMKKAGSKQAFWQVDYEYPLSIGRIAHQHGASTYVLNSAMGANISSRFFYNKVKGTLEQDLGKLGFQSLSFVRPGLISGHRKEFRLGEKMLIMLFSLVGCILPRRWRLNRASKIARTLIECAIKPQNGIQMIMSEQLV